MAGRFTWFDLMAKDPAAAIAFYSSALGFTTEAWSGGPSAYTMLKSGAETFGGVMQLPQAAADMGAPTHWLGYVGVDDLAASVAKARSLGAQVRVDVTEIPNAGRFAVLADPQGATFAMFQSRTPPQGDGGVKAVSWHELMTTDLDGAMAFYGALFGWHKTEAMDMGEMGPYQMFGIGGTTIGGMMRRPPMVPMSTWLYYFHVDDTPGRMAATKAAGGTVLNGPQEVPGGDVVAQLMDPQGGAFAVHAAKK